MKNLARLRKARGLSKTDVADLVGVSAASVWHWETGASYPSIPNLCRLADVFRVSVDYLLGRKTPLAPEEAPLLRVVGGRT